MELPLSLTRRQAAAGAILLVVALAAAGRFLAHAGAAGEDEQVAEVAGAIAAEPVQPEQVVVHVVGAVRSPGLYELPEGSRISDALARAGGATEKADLERVNLASPVADGTQIAVPAQGDPGAPAGGGGPGGVGSGAPGGPVHLNSASAEELERLPGVGPVTAAKIVAHREQHGAFRSVEELQAIPGIGPKRVEALRDLAVP